MDSLPASAVYGI